MKYYGSVHNRLMEGGQTKEEIKVGDGATELMWSDRNPYTVVEIKSPTRIVVQEDEATMKDGHTIFNQEWEYRSCPSAPKVELIKTKKGWKQYKGSSRFIVGYRDKYCDPSF